MESSPFNRQQWTSISLRVTAKELSLVNKNKSSAIVEIFSKYQKAAEEANTEKRSNTETPPQHFRRGILSELKEKWESPAARTDSLQKSSTETRPRGHPPPVEVASSSDPGLRADQKEPVLPRASFRSLPEARSRNSHIRDGEQSSTESEKMENCLGESRHEGEKPENSENAEAASKVEKYNVPLNRLKMMFEKGEPAPTKDSRGLSTRATAALKGHQAEMIPSPHSKRILRVQSSRSAGGRRISENSYSVDDLEIGTGQQSSSAFNSEKSESRRNLELPRLSETSIKDRMAKYQAAVSKQSSSTSYTNELRANGAEIKTHKLEQKENVPPGPDACISHQDGEKVSATETSPPLRSPPADSDSRNAQVKREAQQSVLHKPPSPDARASNLSEISLKAVKKFQAPAREICVECQKTVYPMERLLANQQVFHISCFRCSYCNNKLNLGTYASLRGRIYCKPHFNQLFKSKGNYDEGFGHRPHKDLWANKSENEEAALEKPARVPNAGEPPQSPGVEDAPIAKVGVLTANMEAKTSASPREKEDKPAETKKLRIAWPPPAEPGSPGSVLEEGIKVSKPKWPPEDEISKPEAPEDVNQDLKKLRRSSSLKERCRPFTVAASFRTASVKSPKTLSSPTRKGWATAGQNEELAVGAAAEQKQGQDACDSEKQEAVGKIKSKFESPNQESSKGAEGERENREVHGFEMESEKLLENRANVEEDDSHHLKAQPPAETKDATWSGFAGDPSSKEFTILNPPSQEDGFWEGEDQELSVEEQIKRNRYYDEEEEEE